MQLIYKSTEWHKNGPPLSISQGSVATQLKYGRISNDHFVI